MDTLEFRLARPEDVPSLHRLVESAYRGDSARAGWTHEADLLETPRTSATVLGAVIADPEERLLVAYSGPDLVGCVQVSRRSGATAYLGLLAVDPRRQADGAGRRIMAAAEAEAVKAFGAETMELTVVSRRSELIAYYERRGYVRTGEERPFPIPLDPPLSLAVLEKSLLRVNDV